MSQKLELHQLRIGVYRHYKGNYCTVLGVARHSETGELLVIYVPLYHIPNNEGLFMSVRPLNMFLETVTIGNGHEPGSALYREKIVARFQYVGG
jgi:hypothetical protein